MRRLTLLAVAFLFAAGAGGFCASAQSIAANTRPARASHVEVSIRPQSDSPLRVTFVGESSEDLKTPHVLLAV